MLNILLVDDSELLRNIVAKALGLSGISLGEIYHAGNGEEAMSVLKKQAVDVVFTDINMPVMGGIDLIRAMQADAYLRDLPVMVISTDGSSGRREELAELNVSAFLRKPFHPEQLRELVETVIGNATAT